MLLIMNEIDFFFYCFRCMLCMRYKTRFSNTMFKESSEIGIGVIIWDSQGLVLAPLAENILLTHTITEVVALATVRALSFAQELGFLAIVFEGDSKVIIKALSLHLDTDYKWNYFIIQLIFVIIHGPHCTFWYYSWVLLYYFN